MFGFTLTQLAPVAIGLVGVLLIFGDKLWAMVPALKLPTFTTGGGSADKDVTELQALKVVKARFDRTKCPEGKAACVVLFEHFFHEGA